MAVAIPAQRVSAQSDQFRADQTICLGAGQMQWLNALIVGEIGGSAAA